MISFIVPAYNEEAELPRTLRAIHSAAIGYEYEIVLVNDGSTDATAAIGGQFGAHVISIERRQIAAARNAGAKASRGDVFIFVDADTRIGPEHVRGAMDALENGFAGGGSRLDFDGEIPPWGKA
ncbi:MAG: glycosyl transferase family 2, partial [Verrucomicrobia bacterium]